jgi:hypothetical protein
VGGISSLKLSSLKLWNCIILDNIPHNIEVDGSAKASVSFSCVGGDTLWPGLGNINTDPLFVQSGHWDDNGTPDDSADDVWVEGDYHLQPGSPCIDAGTSEGAPTTDIEGNGRPCGAGVDMGACEMGACAPPPDRFVRGDSNSDGKLNIADPVYTLLYAFADGPAPSCLDTADANDDGAVDIADAIFVLQYLFVTGPMIPQPYPGCGIDPTIDDLNCNSYEPCE